MTPAAMSASALHSDAAAMRRKASELVFSIAWNDDAIAKPADCLDDVRRHLLAQPADENLDRVRVAIEVLIVEMLDQLSAGDDPIAVVHEVFEHAILVRSELHRIAVDGHLAGAAVETRLDSRAGKVTVDGNPVKLTSHEYRVLEYLMHHRDRVVSRTELIEHLYDQDFDRDSNTIEVFVGRLRKKMSADIIETVRGLGYRIVVPGNAEN